MTVGTRGEAEMAALGMLTEIGRGAYRVGYVNDKRTTIYKVNYEGWGHVDINGRPNEYGNEGEHATFHAAKAMGFKSLAPHTLWRAVNRHGEYVSVMAQPYYARSAGWDRNVDAVIQSLPERMQWDLGGNNVRLTSTGRIRVTDMGNGQFGMLGPDL